MICNRALTFMELMLIIKMVKRRIASDHYKTLHAVRWYMHISDIPVQPQPTCGLMWSVMHLPSSTRLFAVTLSTHPHLHRCLPNARSITTHSTGNYYYAPCMHSIAPYLRTNLFKSGDKRSHQVYICSGLQYMQGKYTC